MTHLKDKYNYELLWLSCHRLSYVSRFYSPSIHLCILSRSCACPGEDHPGSSTNVGHGTPEINNLQHIGQVVSVFPRLHLTCAITCMRTLPMTNTRFSTLLTSYTLTLIGELKRFCRVALPTMVDDLPIVAYVCIQRSKDIDQGSSLSPHT